MSRGIIDDPDGPYANSPAGWWTAYGGALHVPTGNLYFPPGTHPPCPFPCRTCDEIATTPRASAVPLPLSLRKDS
ncbi:hypothetical protein [Streptomyces sp. NPDC060194]|uniref:hypothetical protein n=1 Tax=Streptomyces sp. NPDC060194 TaxID=3347069 RepID=UPI00364CCF92